MRIAVPPRNPEPGRSRPMRVARRLVPRSLFAAFAALLGAAVFASAATALPIGCVKTSGHRGGTILCPRVSYRYSTLNDNADTTFNQLLGINQGGVIAGYFGSGAQGHPNQGYLVFPPYFQNYYANNNFPGSVQTQVTGLNNRGTLVGFYSTQNNPSVNGAPPADNNFGWYKLNGHFVATNFPTTDPASPPVDQLLGVNDGNVAVGFFTDGQGNNHGFTYNIGTSTYREVTVPSFTNITAAAINDGGDIAGFGTTKGSTESFLLRANGHVVTIDFPGSSSTQALGVNNSDEVVGFYMVGTGSAAVMHGFTFYPGFGFHTVEAPHGPTTTTINGVDGCGDLVGFYTDSAGNTDGLLASARYSAFAFSVSGSASASSAKAHGTKKVKAKLPKGC